MNYEDLREDAPETVRRLDFIIHDVNPMDTGMLYGALREMECLNKYTPKSDISEAERQELFEEELPMFKAKLEYVNEWMEKHNKEPFFTDITNGEEVGRDFDYFWCLRTRKQFIDEEIAARTGKSERRPVNNIDKEYSEMIQKQIKKMQEIEKAE